MTADDKQPRRKALQKLIIIPIGAAIAVLGAGGLAYFLTQKQTISVKVQYVGMTYVIQQTSEIIKIQSPAKLSDLEDILWQTHPALQTMQNMQVLINGTAAYDDPGLKNGDEVDLIALMAGG